MTDHVEDRDHYLTCNWRPTDSAFHALDLPPLRARPAAARMLILAEAVIVARADPGRWLSYSRRREFYAARPRRYWSPIYTYDTIVPVVDHLDEIGLLEHQKMPPGNLGWQSRFRASLLLMHLMNDHPVSVVQEVGERIILRDHAGDPIDYNDTKQTSRWRRNLEKINALLRSTAIGLGGRLIREGDPLRVDRADVGLACNQLHRVFNLGSFSLGGRFYGGWWQNIPAEYRAAITINGDPTIEMDYPRLHPTLLYDELGLAMHGDPYDLHGTPRPLAKLAFNTLVNADTHQAAIRAIADEIGGEGAFAAASASVSEIEAKHPQIAHMFASGAGRRLMRQDSDMTEHLLLRLEKQGVAALPIHDSYLVRQADKGALAKSMAKTLQKFGRNPSTNQSTYGNSIPQYGAGAGPVRIGAVAARPPSRDSPAGEPPVGSIVMFLPERPQKSFFGPRRIRNFDLG